MAFLTFIQRIALTATVSGASALGACSLVLDPGSLTAERQDTNAESDTVPSDAALPDAVTPDTAETTAPADVADTAEPPDATDSDLPDTLDVAPDVAEVGPTDTEDLDVLGDSDTTLPPADTTADTSLVMAHTGATGCTLDFYPQIVTGCPKTCDWTFAFDASDSVGISSFGWRFSVTGGYILSEGDPTGATPSVTVGTPSCTLFSQTDVGPAKLLVEASINGGPLQVVKTIDFAVRQVASCPTTPRPDCTGP